MNLVLLVGTRQALDILCLQAKKKERMKMTQFITTMLVKFLDVDTLCSLVAKAISSILAYASKKGGKAWETAKTAITKINLWTSLFLQVYEDDTLDAEDEKKIADAIKKETDIAKLVDILKKDKEAK